LQDSLISSPTDEMLSFVERDDEGNMSDDFTPSDSSDDSEEDGELSDEASEDVSFWLLSFRLESRASSFVTLSHSVIAASWLVGKRSS